MKFLASTISLCLILARYATSQTQATAVASAEVTAQCSRLAKTGQSSLPLVKTCEFALSFRHSLPNFICEQNMENSGWPHTTPPVEIHAKVRHENGRDSYSDLIVNGERVEQQNMEAIEGMSVATSGEFGSQLMNLFRAPMVAECPWKTRGDRPEIVSSDVAQLEGSVADEDGAVMDAQVRLALDPWTLYNGPRVHRTTTDQLGHFSFTDVPPGKYRLTVNR